MNIVFDPNGDGNLLITLDTLTPILGGLLMGYAFKVAYNSGKYHHNERKGNTYFANDDY